MLSTLAPPDEQRDEPNLTARAVYSSGGGLIPLEKPLVDERFAAERLPTADPFTIERFAYAVFGIESFRLELERLLAAQKKGGLR